jgi:hypothetical protein
MGAKMAKIKKDTSLRKAILQAAITGQLKNVIFNFQFKNLCIYK